MTIKCANTDNHNGPRITSVELKPVSYPKFKEDNCLNNGRYLETVFYSLPNSQYQYQYNKEQIQETINIPFLGHKYQLIRGTMTAWHQLHICAECCHHRAEATFSYTIRSQCMFQCFLSHAILAARQQADSNEIALCS